MGFFFRCRSSQGRASPGPRGTWSQCLCFQEAECHQASHVQPHTPPPRDTEAAFKGLQRAASQLHLLWLRALSFFLFPSCKAESLHVAIFIFPSIPINFLTHFTQLMFLFTSVSPSSAHSTCVNYFSRQCDHCKWAHLGQGLPTSPSHRWPQPLWSPEHNLNYSQLPSMGSGGRHCPKLVLFHTCSLFISRHNGGAWSENPKMW